MNKLAMFNGFLHFSLTVLIGFSEQNPHTIFIVQAVMLVGALVLISMRGKDE